MLRTSASTALSLSRQSRPNASACRMVSTSAGPASSTSRRGLYLGTAAALIVGGGLWTLNGPTLFSEDRSEYQPVAGDVRPHPLWSPPTRAQMIAALKQSSGKSLRPQASRESNDNHSLQNKEKDLTSSTPSPSARQHSGGARMGKDGDEDGEGFDLVIVGGGATGAGVAVDAATRGLSVAMVERDDFGAGTSSKSTKLIHGGVRYLQKAVFELDYDQYKMVREALHERKTFLHIAPYLSEHLPIMLPVYRWWQVPYYYAGTKMYDMLAGGENMESSYVLSRGKALEKFPMLKAPGLVGAVVYYDGQHNDTRMNVALALTAVHHGAVVANHTSVIQLHKKPVEGKADKVCGVRLRDELTGDEWDVKCKGVINATGPFSDALRKMDVPTAQEIVAPSSGVHITLPGYYSPRDMGLIDPQTSDGRVIFFLPWQGNTIAGTTDTAAPVEAHPRPKEEEIQWILDEVRNYLSPDIKVRRADVLSAWSGLRPLVKDPDAKDTQSLVRNHMINVSDSGLLTIAGGKWTTYREMAEQTVDRAIQEFHLEPLRECVTKETRLLGSHGWSKTMYVKLLQRFGLETDVAKHLSATYGDRAWSVCSIAEGTGMRWPVHGIRLDPLYPYLEAEVRYACRSEYAATVADFVARRTRLSFLNVEATVQALPRIIDLMASELGWDQKRKDAEFKDSIEFLGSMGLQPGRLESLRGVTLAELTKTARQSGTPGSSFPHLGKASLDEQDASATIVSRAQFSSEEMSQLRKQFDLLDANSDGKLDVKDLKEVLSRLGYQGVEDNTVAGILSEVDVGRAESLHFEDFLDVCAAFKDVRLDNAFTSIIKEVESGKMRRIGDPVGSVAQESSQRRDERRTIPAERSGGGCCMLEQGGADASPLVGAVVFSFYSSPPLCQWGQIMSAIINRGEHASQSIHSTTTQDSTHSMPSSLMTDEDWDQLLAKEQQESRPSCISSSGADAMEDVQGGSVSPLKVGGKGANGAKSTHTSPIKVGRDSGHHSTPSSPSKILRLTRRNTGPSEERGSTVEEAAQFEKELGDWINNEHSPFEDGGKLLRALKSA